MPHLISIRQLAFALLASIAANTETFGQAPRGEWSSYGHDPLGSRFSPLAQITRENVDKLAVAWSYRTGDAEIDTRATAKFEATPLMVDGTLYLSTPLG